MTKAVAEEDKPVDPKQEAKANQLILKGREATGQQEFKSGFKIWSAVAKLKGASAATRSLGEINAGICLHMLKETEKGIKWLTRALGKYSESTLKPNVFYAVLSLATSYKDVQDFESADARFKTLSAMPEFKQNFALKVRTIQEHSGCLLKASRRGFAANSSYFEGRDVLREATGMIETVLGKEEKVPLDVIIILLAALDDAGRTKARKKMIKWAIKQGYMQSEFQYPKSVDYNMPVPTSPWWSDFDKLPIIEEMVEKWAQLRQEYDSIQASKLTMIGERIVYDRDIYNHAAGGRWAELTMFDAGEEKKEGSALAPLTAEIFRGEPRVAQVKTGQVVYSVLFPGTFVRKHCGPTNEMITCHLGIHVPGAGIDKVGISVGGKKRRWEEGKVLCFEDSMEHYVWNDSDETRVVLLFNVRHPLSPRWSG